MEVKEQGIVRLQDVAERVLFHWKQFVDVIGLLLSQRRTGEYTIHFTRGKLPSSLDNHMIDAYLGWTCLKSGIELINSVPRLAREFTGARGLDNGNVLDAIALPEITFDAPLSWVLTSFLFSRPWPSGRVGRWVD